MILMQRAQPHPSAAAELPCRPPIMCLEIVQQRNLLLQLVESLAIHGLLASSGRIRQQRGQIPGKDGGRLAESARPVDCLHQHHTLSSRRHAHRRRVDGSGKRDGSLQCGAACSATSPALIRSQACWRQRKREMRRTEPAIPAGS